MLFIIKNLLYLIEHLIILETKFVFENLTYFKNIYSLFLISFFVVIDGLEIVSSEKFDFIVGWIVANIMGNTDLIL